MNYDLVENIFFGNVNGIINVSFPSSYYKKEIHPFFSNMWVSVVLTLFLAFNHCFAVDSNTAAVPTSGLVNIRKPWTSKRVVTWHTIQFPSKPSPPLREHEGEAATEDEEENTLEDILFCGPECKGYVNDTVTDTKAVNEFAYEVFTDEGTDKVVEIDLDSDFLRYLNRWRDGERRLKLREKETKSDSRRRREVIVGDDTRFTITDREWLNQTPFTTNVKISSGCSGVLISEIHVLTAASCVHNGRKMINKIRDFEVGIRQKRQLSRDEEMGKNWKEAFRWIPVKKIFVPKEWSSKPPKGKKGKAELPVDKNYALIQLKREADRDFLNVSVGSVANVGEGKRIHFSSFDEIARPTLNYRFCKVMEETMEILYQQCDGTPQSIGAGIYVRRWNKLTRNWERNVVGIFTGHQIFYLEDGSTRERNLAVKVTPLKFAQICFWMTGDYGECRG